MSADSKAVIEHSAYPPIEYNITETTVAALKEKYGAITEVTADNYDTVKEGVSKMTKLRTGVEAHRNVLLKDARDFTESVNNEAKRVTKLVADVETPLKNRKVAYDIAVKAAKEKEKAKEQERTDAINAKIDAIESAGRDLDGLTAEQLRERKGNVEALEVTEDDYQEFWAVALERHESTIARLTVAHGKAVARELEAQQLKEAQDKLAEEKAEAEAAQKVIDDANAAAQKKLDDDRAEFEAEKKARDDADAAAASEEQAKADAEAQAARDEEIAQEAAAEALAQKELADLEAEELAAEKLAIAPDRIKLKHFADMIQATAEAAPELEHDKARKVLARSVAAIVQTADSLQEWAEKL